MFRGDPDEVDLSDGFRWGFGAGFPTRKGLRVTAELHGEKQFDDVVYTGDRLASSAMTALCRPSSLTPTRRRTSRSA